MLKTALIHKIIEISINNLFDGIIAQFGSNGPTGYYIGLRFKELHTETIAPLMKIDSIFYNGIIVDINDYVITIHCDRMQKTPTFFRDSARGLRSTRIGTRGPMSYTIPIDTIVLYNTY